MYQCAREVSHFSIFSQHRAIHFSHATPSVRLRHVYLQFHIIALMPKGMSFVMDGTGPSSFDGISSIL